MKRLLIFLMFILIIIIVYINKDKGLFNYKNITKVCIISKNSDIFAKEEVVKNGSQFYYILSREEAEDNVKTFDEIDGVVLYLENSNVEKIASYYHISYHQGKDIEDYKIYYGYTPRYSKFQFINGRKINAQIVVGNEQIILGFPMILTGF